MHVKNCAQYLILTHACKKIYDMSKYILQIRCLNHKDLSEYLKISYYLLTLRISHI